MSNSKTALRTIRDAIESKKGEDILILDISKLSSFADYFVICTASNPKQSQAIADEVRERLERLGIRPLHIEGRRSADWILIDYAQIIVHVFSPAYRDFYALEKLWSDGAVITAEHLKARRRLP